MGWSGRGIAALVVILGALAPAPARAQTTTPPGADPWIVDRPRFEPLDGSPLRVDGLGDYRGAIELTRSPATTNRLAVINRVHLEDYLKGISEVPSAWPLEAQKAQAVAARTYALYEATRVNPGLGYKQAGADICATQSCQVYVGLEKERRAGSEAWSAAVAQTRNQILLYKDQPIVAKYSSSNGGHTVSGGQPYLTATPDPDDVRSPLHQWRASYPVADVARVTGLAAEPFELHRDDDEIVATYLDPDGNPIEQRVPTVAFRDRIVDGFASPPGLPLPVPSMRFDVQVELGMVHLDGRGWGHGIGLSQYGALGKALRGMKAPDILAAYYAGLRPTAAPERMPQQLKVALALDRPDVVVAPTGTGRVRVVDGSGRVLAQATAGTWRAAPAPDGRIKLTPPADEAGAPSASVVAVRPDHPVAGQALGLTVQLDGPAAVTQIDLVRPGGAAEPLDAPKLRLPGPVQVRLGTAQSGTYRLDLRLDAGNGRLTATSLTVEVAPGPGGAAAGRDTDGDDTATVSEATDLDLAFAGADAAAEPFHARRVLQATATFMLLAVIVLGAFWVGRRPGVELH